MPGGSIKDVNYKLICINAIGALLRLDMIDEAILRPGRMEVHVEIGLPDANGREQVYLQYAIFCRHVHVYL